MRKIVTTHICPPIPVRQFDWCAHYEGMEETSGNYGYGYGATEVEAIADFKAICAENELSAKIAEADMRGNACLAEANEAAEAGQHAKAERLYARGQKWLDRSNALRGSA